MKGKVAADLEASLFLNFKLFTYPYPVPVLPCPVLSSHILPHYMYEHMHAL